MREIKFRYYHNNWGMSNVITFGDWGKLSYNYDEGCVSVMQYVGVKDLNGKEIYEGDICQNERGEIGIIKFINGGFCSEYIPPHNWDVMEPADGLLHRQTVLGNIYENPELLTQLSQSNK